MVNELELLIILPYLQHQSIIGNELSNENRLQIRSMLINKIERLEDDLKELKEEIAELDMKILRNSGYEIEGNSELRNEMNKADREQSREILKIKNKLRENADNWKILLGVVALVLFSYWFNS